MRCRDLARMIALVSALTMVNGAALGASPPAKRTSPSHPATATKAPIPVRVMRGGRRSPGVPGTIEIVTFADTLPAVRVVRGGGGLSAAALARDRVVPAPAARGANPEIVIAFADPHRDPVTVLRGAAEAVPDTGLYAPTKGLDLDRVAFAVDGAESSHGTDPGMWRLGLDGPQGPMQVSAAAALDLGGGDRFDIAANRSLGRGYLALLYRRYGNWPDAIAAYNWGPGNLDAWIGNGRPAAGLPPGVERYRDRVLRDSDLPAPAAEPGGR
jgi:hypothetical protein